MTNNPLQKKLRLKSPSRCLILEAPDGYLDRLGPLPEEVSLSTTIAGEYDWIQVFARDQRTLNRLAPDAIATLKQNGLMWICFPKGTSGLQSDLTRDVGWDVVVAADLKWTNLVSIDETWSAFSLRPFKPGEERKSFR